MSERVLIGDLAAREDGPVTVSGWVETVRDQKKVQFVILRDESGALQLVHRRRSSEDRDGDSGTPAPSEPAGGPRHGAEDPIAETISSLEHGSFVTVTGELKHDERVKLGGIEVGIATLTVETRAIAETPIAADSSLDKRQDWRFLDLRHPRNALVFRVQTTLEHAFRSYWVERGYIELHTPKLMASASESKAELFKVEYFDTTAYLAQSPQFFKQMAQSAGFGKVFEIGPVFRADPSFTSRHATEFTGVDAEISWIDGVEDVMRMQEELLAAGIAAVKERHGDEILEHFGVEVTVPTVPFPRIPLSEAHRIIREERGYTVPRADGDLDPEGERQIAAWVKERHGHDFVFLTDYPASIRPFYHMRDAETGLTKSYDLLMNGVEITTGAQREHRVEVLEAQAREKGLEPEELGFYLDFFRYGAPPHGGFGMGLARVLMLLLNEQSIREVTYLFRGPNRLLP